MTVLVCCVNVKRKDTSGACSEAGAGADPATEAAVETVVEASTAPLPLPLTRELLLADADEAVAGVPADAP